VIKRGGFTMAITITPSTMMAINLAIELALLQLTKNMEGMTEAELDQYIVEQQIRKAQLLAKIDEA